MSNESIDIYLCITEPEAGRYKVCAVYDNEFEAEAWVEGTKAAYMDGYYMAIGSNEGAIDIGDWVRSWRDAE